MKLMPDRFRRWVNKRMAYPPNWLTRLFGEADETVSAGVSVTAETALKYVAFYAGVDLISRQIGQLPMHVYRMKPNGDREKAMEHPIYKLLHTRPNPEQTAYKWRETMQSWTLRWGNGYSEIQRDGMGRPVALWPMRSDQMELERLETGQLQYIQRSSVGKPNKVLLPENVLHFHGMGDGLVGKSVITLHAEAIGEGMAAQKAAASLYGKGLRPGSILKHPGTVSDTALRHLKESMHSEYGGPQNVGKNMVLEEGMDFAFSSIPPKDAQFLESRSFQVREVARILHIPPHKLQDTEPAGWNANIEERNIEFVTDTLAPWAVNIEQECDWKLFMPSERGVYFTKFSLEALMRGNAQARSEFYSKMFSIGALSDNQILEKEDMNGMGPSGDVHYVPLNMVPAEIAMKGPRPKQSEPDGTQSLPGGTQPIGAKSHVREAQFALLRATWERVIRRDANALRRTMKKPQAAETFGMVFDEERTQRTCAILAPAFSAVYAAAGRWDGQETVAAYADRTVRKEIAELRAMMDGGDAELRLIKWEAGAAAKFAAMNLQDLME